MNDTIAHWSRKWALTHGIQFWFASETDSTNARAKADFSSGAYAHPEPIIYVTDHQTAGRGRGTHHWYDGANSAFLSSWSFSVTKAPQPILSPLVGLALFDALRDSWPHLPWSLKLPNDVFLEKGKIGGILIENIEVGDLRRSVIGIGLNIHSRPAQTPDATALKDFMLPSEVLQESAWHRFLSSLYPQLEEAVRKGQKTEINPTDRHHLLNAVNANPLRTSPAKDVDPQGHLVE